MTRQWLLTPTGLVAADSVPLSDRGFRYGMAFFETLRVDEGRVRFLLEHLASLALACAAGSFPIPPDELARAGRLLQEQLAAPADTGVARLHVTAGDGGPGEPVSACRVYLTFAPRDPAPAAAYRLRTGEGAHQPLPGGRKSHNYWGQTAALRAARDAGADEALLFDAAGRLVSAAMANVFIVEEDGAISTPPAEAGARAGIVRAWVIGQRPVQEKNLDTQDLRRAAEVFLTNSWLGVQPVALVDGRRLTGQTVAAGLRSDLQACYERNR